MPQRTYDEEEVAALLRRATELQAQALPRDPYAGGRPGLTLEELIAVAASAGLDPEYIRQAAAEVGGRRARAAVHVSAKEVVADRWAPGGLTDEAKEEILMELRHRFEDGGARAAWGMSTGMGAPYGTATIQTLGRSVEWSYVNPGTGTQTRVLLQPREGGVRVRVARANAYTTEATGWSVWYAPFLALLVALVAGLLVGSFPIAVLSALLTLAVTAPLLARVRRSALEHQREEAERLADEIASYVQPPRVESASAAPGEHVPEPRLDLPDEGAWGQGERSGAESERRVRER